jgi:HEAT repeat protein
VRYAAISQFDRLGQQNETVAWELLRDRLRNDPEIDVKSAAADAIGTLKLPEAFEELQQTYFQTQEWLLQMSIIATLGELGDPRGLDLLKASLSNENEMVLTAAIGAIGELGDPQAVANVAGAIGVHTEPLIVSAPLTREAVAIAQPSRPPRMRERRPVTSQPEQKRLTRADLYARMKA